MKQELMTEIMQQMLPCLDNAQLKQLRQAMEQVLSHYAVTGVQRKCRAVANLNMKEGDIMSYCSWGLEGNNRQYHDEEWGIPVHEDRKQFEYLMLEVMQKVTCLSATACRIR